MKTSSADYHLAAQAQEIDEMSRRQGIVQNKIAGIDLTVTAKVYPGGLDSELMCEEVKVSPGDKVLDLCTGTGIIALKAALLGAKNVIGIDLNPNAIKAANLNKSKLGLKSVDFLEGDLFSPVKGMKFDVITINPPYTSKKPANKTEICFWDEDNQTTKKFFKEFKNYLNPGGRVYFAWADFATYPDLPKDLAKKQSASTKLLRSKRSSSGMSTFLVYQVMV